MTSKDWGSFGQEIEKLKNSDGKTIPIESGLKTWQLFLENGLFDELRLVIHPVIAVQGDKLFSDESAKVSLHLMSSKAHKNGVTSLTYQRR
ncbi:dihydrofolate reductase family protein [Spirosoma validum]|uniref:Dihydrofolate reductase family protein n=1 Tax=Spirosoma validum TaxID=2771355 RepID=A0A927B5D4_9BACT|nr:dihydrofolate reductase family protein [Spirosoma validum]